VRSPGTTRRGIEKVVIRLPLRKQGAKAGIQTPARLATDKMMREQVR
jgi:hypothetical protein